jgi:putative membrane protein
MMGLGYGGLGMVLMILFWVAIIVLAIWALGKLFPQMTGFTAPPSRDRPGETAESPLDILKRRFARGELSQAEYDDMRRKLLD